jgi:hypothetical protein
MRNILLSALIAATLYSPASAAKMSNTELCSMISELAKTVMTKRQEGVLMSVMLTALEKVEQNPYTILTKTLVITAYDRPRFSTAEYKHQAVIDFANSSMSACVENTH